MAENFPNVAEDRSPQIQDARTLRINPKKSMPKHVIIQPLKIKDKVLKADESQVTPYLEGKTTQTTVDFSPETMEPGGSGTPLFRAERETLSPQNPVSGDNIFQK